MFSPYATLLYDSFACCFILFRQTESDTRTSNVKYGTVSGQYTSTVTGYSKSYYETFHHHAVLSNLPPSTNIFYTVGDDAGSWSKEYVFTSAPISSAEEQSLTFAVFADLGVVNGDSSINFLKSIANSTALVWHGGDISYADDAFLHKGCMFNFCYEETWDQFMNEMEPVVSQIPYMVAPGNHEAECHDPSCLSDADRREKLSNFTAYNTRFRMPSPESGSGALNMHYSFNFGPVHFVSIDTETGFPGAAEESRYVLPCGGFEEQMTWLEADLIEANKHRDVRPWIFVQGHHPMYQGNSVNEDFQSAMEDLFYKYGVDVYFSGHVHSYERDYPTYKGVPELSYENPRATTYFMIGGAGNDEMQNAEAGIPEEKLTAAEKERKEASNEGSSRWRKGTAEGAWTVVTDAQHLGIATVSIKNANELTFNYYQTTTGVLFDTVTLTRDHSSPYGLE
jgi:hypothetical protein